MIDSNGFRANVGIILCAKGQVFWGKRVGQDAWQFPQGGVNNAETAEECLYRELREEVGLEPEDVTIMRSTRSWLKYRIPRHMIRSGSDSNFIGQKQKWYLLKFNSDDSKVNLNLSDSPEFDDWAWVNYWYGLRYVISFKREVYREALLELAPAFMHTQPNKKSYLDCLYHSNKDHEFQDNYN